MTLIALALCSSSHAASLDLLEVGGAYGTPAATNPSAVWWNPAGLAVNGGTQFMIELAPTFAGIDANRTQPAYPDPTASMDFFYSQGYPQDPQYGGQDHITFNGVVPFVGVSSDLTVKGLGVGLGMAVPTARGGVSDMATNANRYALRAGSIQDIHVILGAGYQLKDKVALGASLHYVDASYYADIDSTSYPDIAWAVAEEVGVMPPSYQDMYNELDGYAADVIMGGEKAGGKHGALHDRTFTFSLGTHVTPLPKERMLDIAVAYVHGVSLNTEGDLTMKFACAGEWDEFSQQYVFDANGLCNSTFQGKGSIAYDLPGRVQFGIASSPIDRLRVELMGAYVMWSVFTDFDIVTEVSPDQVPVDDPTIAAETSDLVSQHRLWARDNQDTFWLGLDGKMQLHKYVTGGLRVLYDHHAVPSNVVSINNLDNDTVALTGMAMVSPTSKLGIGLSFGHAFLASRTITDSAFAVSLADANPNGETFYGNNPDIDRYFYPESNGTYSGGINRLGITLKGNFGGSANDTW
ncbi:MAG: outer membrane protein transport protein [Myxococcales bacterium]|nr:outer membrane protein transport protein [Myxococcales bacterium]